MKVADESVVTVPLVIPVPPTVNVASTSNATAASVISNKPSLTFAVNTWIADKSETSISNAVADVTVNSCIAAACMLIEPAVVPLVIKP